MHPRLPVVLLVACHASAAFAGADKPWADMDSSGGDILGGLVLILIVYGLWRLVASGDLGPLLAAVTRFLLAVYLPVGLFLALALLIAWGLRSIGAEKEVAGVLGLLIAAAATWAAVRYGVGRSGGRDAAPPASADGPPASQPGAPPGHSERSLKLEPSASGPPRVLVHHSEPPRCRHRAPRRVVEARLPAAAHCVSPTRTRWS
ncbi:MAG: hypothetical protein R3E78_16150 [Burkholderiaceae bacterium]